MWISVGHQLIGGNTVVVVIIIDVIIALNCEVVFISQ
jgi:hypothetical protein